MSGHHEATAGAVGNNALCVKAAYGHNESSGPDVIVEA
jgi:hypothetical protein